MKENTPPTATPTAPDRTYSDPSYTHPGYTEPSYTGPIYTDSAPADSTDTHPAPGALTAPAPTTPVRARTTVDLLVPVYNEEHQLRDSVEKLLAFTAGSPHDVTIVVADNASTDATPLIGSGLAHEYPRVRYIRLEQKGRGRALRHIWSRSYADVLAYTDVDLATDIHLLDPMVSAVAPRRPAGESAAAPAHGAAPTSPSAPNEPEPDNRPTGNLPTDTLPVADIAIASRLLTDSRVERGVKREIISRCYNRLLRATMDVDYSDAQCGFKVVNRRAAEALLPHITDTGWFFDTELLTLARWSGLRVHEFAADWTDDPDSSVDVTSTALDDLRGMLRMRRTLARGDYPLAEIARRVGRSPARPNTGTQILHFVDVGILCTLAYSLLFLLLTALVPTQIANVLALLLSTLVNTALNRRYSFGIRNPEGIVRHHLKGLAVFGLCWLLTSSAITLTAGLTGTWAPLEVLSAVTAANVLATVLRFALHRTWVFADSTPRKHRHV